jgi:hypothetical protein
VYGDLVKQASELRDILGLSKCSTLLSNALVQQSKVSETDHLTDDKPPSVHPTTERPRAPSALRAEAIEWTPPKGTESPRTILKRVLGIGTNGDTALPTAPPSLLPSMEYSPAPGTYYMPRALDQAVKSDIPKDLTGDGKQFISSLAAKGDIGVPVTPQQPLGVPNKHPVSPPGLILPTVQRSHSFPLVTSLLPQTFSVHLLSTLHMRLQHVSAALEMLDSSFATEIKKTASIKAPNSTRWDNWMSPSGAAGMNKALLELRRSLDELCGATSRAGWIVDTWGAYQGGTICASKDPDSGLGSSAINGVEIGLEAGDRLALQAPIGRPNAEKLKTSQQEEVEIGDGTSCPTTVNISDGKAVPPSTWTGTFRPPPGLAFPMNISTNGIEQSPTAPLGNGSKYFLTAPNFVEDPTITRNGNGNGNGIRKEKLNFRDNPQVDIALLKHQRQGTVSTSTVVRE